MRGHWRDHARLTFKGAAAYAAKIAVLHPEERITVWEKNFEAAVKTARDVTYSRELGNPEHKYIATVIHQAILDVR